MKLNLAMYQQLPIGKGYFPYRALDNRRLYSKLEGDSFDDVRHLYDCQMHESPSQKEAREKWLDEQVLANRTFSLPGELVKYGEKDTQILTVALCNIIDNCFEQQMEVLHCSQGPQTRVKKAPPTQAAGLHFRFGSVLPVRGTATALMKVPFA